MRFLLRNELEKQNVKGNWEHITSQIGMFSFTGLTEKQCKILIEKSHVYLLKSGRISMVFILFFKSFQILMFNFRLGSIEKM